MLVKINNLNKEEKKANVTLLDIDDFGSIVPLKDLDLRIPSDDNSIIEILANSPYAAVFTEGGDESNSMIILANGITIDEINKEKFKTIEKAKSRI
jgi:hypothetical protein